MNIKLQQGLGGSKGYHQVNFQNHLVRTISILFLILCSLYTSFGQSPGHTRANGDLQHPDLGIFDLKVTKIDGYPENKTSATVQSYTFKYSATVMNYGEKASNATNFKIKLEIMNGQSVLLLNKTHSIGKLNPSEKKSVSGQFTFTGTWLYWYNLTGTIGPVTGDLNGSNNSKTIHTVLRVN